MNSHIPFDADNDWTLDPYHCNQSNDPLVDKVIGNAYAVVRAVYCNLGNLKLLYDFLNTYGMVLGVKSEAELKKLNKLAKYARIYGYASTGDRQVTDYLYVPDDTSGIRPDDPTATGSWIKVATSETGGGGEGGGQGAYIPYVYANGSALGGETSFKVPDGTVGVPFLIINGSVQYIGFGFTYSAATATVTLSNPLVQGDEVIALTTAIPANPDNPEVPGWVQVNWLYNNGSAIGGEQVITVPYNFQDVPAVYKNGLRLYKGLQSNSYVIDPVTHTVTMTEILTQGDRVILTLGGESETITINDRTLQEVARSTNAKDSDVILSTTTNLVITGKKIIYDVVAQKSWSLPDLPPNAYIVKVEGDKLTYNPGNVTVSLLPLPEPALDAYKAKLSSDTGYTHIGGLNEHFSLPSRWVVVDNAPYYGDLDLAVSTNPDNTAFLLGKGKSYNLLTFRTARNTKKNLTFFGSGMPALADDKRSFVAGSGTIIKGPVKTEVAGLQLVNLGIDCGAVVSTELFSGGWDDPIQCYGIGKNANIFIDNVKTLSHTNLTGPNYPGTHSLLLQQLDGAYVGKVELIGGFHGLTLKGTNIDVMTAHCYGQRGDAFIIKSDSLATAADIYIGKLKVGLRDNTGFTDVTMGGIYDAHDNVNIDNVEIGSLIVYNASWGLIPSNENTGYVSNLRIGNYVAMNVYGNYYSLVIDSRCVGVSIGEHQCSNTSGGISVDGAAVNVSLGNGFSKGSTKSGYALGSNSLVHGNLIADENGEYGVDYKGGVGLNISKILGYSNAFGLVSSVPTPLNGNAPQNGWSDSGGFMAQLMGKTVTISGSMVRGTGGVVYTTLAICKPKKRIPIAAWGVTTGGSMVPVECYVETNGNINVVGYASVAEGGTVNFSGQYVIY